jgi:hypothetical protein
MSDWRAHVKDLGASSGYTCKSSLKKARTCGALLQLQKTACPAPAVEQPSLGHLPPFTITTTYEVLVDLDPELDKC